MHSSESPDLDVAGYVAIGLPNQEAFTAALASPAQLWSSLYILYFNMPWLPELAFTLANARLVALAVQFLPPKKRRIEPPSPEVLHLCRSIYISRGGISIHSI